MGSRDTSLSVYHGYDLGEFDNRWSDPSFTPNKLDLMKKSFGTSMLIAAALKPTQCLDPTF